MNTDPNEIQKMNERIEALEKQITEWKIRYEEQKRIALYGAGTLLVFLLITLIKR
jgi:archaellum component FlaC